MTDHAKTHAVATKFYALLEKGDFDQAIHDHYAEDCEHVEAFAGPGMQQVTQGRAAILENSKKWNEDTTIHGSELRGPFSHTNSFTVYMKLDVTMKSMGNQRMDLEEVCLYHLKGDEISRVEFFYGPYEG